MKPSSNRSDAPGLQSRGIGVGENYVVSALQSGAVPSCRVAAAQSRGNDHEDGRTHDGDDPTGPVDAGAAVAAECGVDEPPDDDAANATQDGQPHGGVVLVSWSDPLPQEPDD